MGDRMNFLKMLMFWKRKSIWKPTKVINMWEHNVWGDTINWISWENKEIYGFSEPCLYDTNTEVRSKMKSGKIARFKIIDIDYKADPNDMFFATLEYLGYLEYEGY
jgi:hypothetical protein